MKKSLAMAVLAAGLLAGNSYGGQGAEGTVTIVATNQAVWQNTTWRQWVGSISCTFPTNTPISTMSINLVDGNNYTNLLASAVSSNMQSVVYVSERGPIVLDVGDKIVINDSSGSRFVARINNLTGE